MGSYCCILTCFIVNLVDCSNLTLIAEPSLLRDAMLSQKHCFFFKAALHHSTHVFMCLDYITLFLHLRPVTNCEQRMISRSDGQRILSSGFSCLVSGPEFAVTVDPLSERSDAISHQPVTASGLDQSFIIILIHHPCAGLEVYFENNQFRGVLRRQAVSYSFYLLVYLSFLLPFDHQI